MSLLNNLYKKLFFYLPLLQNLLQIINVGMKILYMHVYTFHTTVLKKIVDKKIYMF